MSFTFEFTARQVSEILDMKKDMAIEWHNAMTEILPKYDINTPERVAGFIAQTGHESNGYRVLTENLNYSAKALNGLFSKYFARAGRDANDYHRQPEKIANVIYAGRMDNGDTNSGDGWKFRGGGILQLTGRYNYTQFGQSVGMSAEQATDYVRTPTGALESACWFWKTNDLNKYCDRNDIVKLSKRVNGGTIGLEDRVEHWEHAMELFTGKKPTGTARHSAPSGTTLLKKGSKGSLVKKMQEVLGVDADGDFGPGTERSVKHWQAEHGLTADGIVGPATLAKMGIS
tara:strand:- start:168 stop:1028 length:861 start_codon:yes stop_codon:yes gene_type:complete